MTPFDDASRKAMMDAAFGAEADDPYAAEMAAAMAETSGLDLPFALTTFKDFAATSKQEEVITLADLAERIRTTSAPQQGRVALVEAGQVRRHPHSQPQPAAQ